MHDKTANQFLKPQTLCKNAQGNLSLGGCDLVELAGRFATPLYVMDEDTLLAMIGAYKQAFAAYPKTKIMFASKALMTGAIAKLFDQNGLGFDVVSGGEIYTLLHAGISLKNTCFNGNNKSLAELNLALDHHIDHISVDNFWELEQLNTLCAKRGMMQKIHLRLTPGIECHTHEYIRTGQIDSKFGFDLNSIDKALALLKTDYPHLNLTGLHAHIGSQIFETKVYDDEVKVLLTEMKRIQDTFGFALTELNIGGGLGITYTAADTPPSVFQIADNIITSLQKNCTDLGLDLPTLYIEPGRSLVGSAGVTLYTIGARKDIPNVRTYLSVDGGMADNPRPALYQALYEADIANAKQQDAFETVTVAGRFCESGDILMTNVRLNAPKTGDILCVYDTGAYCYSMASNYNRTLTPAMVLVKDGNADIIIRRQTYEQLVQNDIIPDRLK